MEFIEAHKAKSQPAGQKNTGEFSNAYSRWREPYPANMPPVTTSPQLSKSFSQNPVEPGFSSSSSPVSNTLKVFVGLANALLTLKNIRKSSIKRACGAGLRIA